LEDIEKAIVIAEERNIILYSVEASYKSCRDIKMLPSFYPVKEDSILTMYRGVRIISSAWIPDDMAVLTYITRWGTRKVVIDNIGTNPPLTRRRIDERHITKTRPDKSYC